MASASFTFTLTVKPRTVPPVPITYVATPLVVSGEVEEGGTMTIPFTLSPAAVPIDAHAVGGVELSGLIAAIGLNPEKNAVLIKAGAPGTATFNISIEVP